MAFDSDQAIKPPLVLLTGASSQIGVFVIPRLVKSGFQVIAVSRKGRPAWFPGMDGVTWVTVAEAMTTVSICDFLISTGPMELAQKLLEGGDKLQSVIVFSSSSVASKQQSGNLDEKHLMQEMLGLESRLLSMAEQRDVRLTIFRPTLIYGCGLDANISRLAKWIRRFGFMLINGEGRGLRQPVHAQDLAEVALAALQCQASLPPILSLPGGETLSYSEMVSRIFKAHGRPLRLIRLPQWLFIFLTGIAGIFPIGRGINGEMVRRQNTDLLFADREAGGLLNYKPRGFNPVEADFALPDFNAVDTDTAEN